jgi:hypothetical protein
MYNDIVVNFIFSALDQGWSVKKNKDFFIFFKKHENKKEVFSEKYLKNFIKENLKIE